MTITLNIKFVCVCVVCFNIYINLIQPKAIIFIDIWLRYFAMSYLKMLSTVRISRFRVHTGSASFVATSYEISFCNT